MTSMRNEGEGQVVKHNIMSEKFMFVFIQQVFTECLL